MHFPQQPLLNLNEMIPLELKLALPLHASRLMNNTPERVQPTQLNMVHPRLLTRQHILANLDVQQKMQPMPRKMLLTQQHGVQRTRGSVTMV